MYVIYVKESIEKNDRAGALLLALGRRRAGIFSA
jgi:hypothetical protein